MYIKPLELTITETADGLGVSRKQLSAILNERAGISPEMAIRLSEAFSTSVEFWMGLQAQYDTWLAESTISREGIRHFHPRAAS